MARNALDTDIAWQLILNAANRSNITLPAPGSDQPSLKINGKSWELVQPASEQVHSLFSLFMPLCRPAGPVACDGGADDYRQWPEQSGGALANTPTGNGDRHRQARFTSPITPPGKTWFRKPAR